MAGASRDYAFVETNMADDLLHDLNRRLCITLNERRALGEYDANAVVILEMLEVLAPLASRLEMIASRLQSLEDSVDTMQASIRASQAVSTWSDSTPAGADLADWRKRKPRTPAGGKP